MDIQYIDELAANGNTFLHRAIPGVKMIAAAMLLAAAISTATPEQAGLVLAAMLAAIYITGQPVKVIASAAIYPAVFAVIFTLGFMFRDPLGAVHVVIKAYTAGLIMITLLATTSFVDVFGTLGRTLPPTIADALFMGYRAFFILLSELGDLLTAVRLRGGTGAKGGISGFLERLKTYGEIMGVLVLHSMDMTERTYRIMQIRGYSGRISTYQEPRPMGSADIASIAFSSTVLVTIILLRWTR